MSTETIPVSSLVANNARFLNDTIARGTLRLGGEEIPVDFYCECGDPGCRQVTRLTIGQYDKRRSTALIAHPEAA